MSLKDRLAFKTDCLITPIRFFFFFSFAYTTSPAAVMKLVVKHKPQLLPIRWYIHLFVRKDIVLAEKRSIDYFFIRVY